MEYHFSHLVDPSTYETNGLCDGIPLRVHRSSGVGDLGMIRLHILLKRLNSNRSTASTTLVLSCVGTSQVSTRQWIALLAPKTLLIKNSD